MDRPGLRTPANPRIPASNRIRAELGRKAEPRLEGAGLCIYPSPYPGGTCL